jgi:hypothetical protein
MKLYRVEVMKAKVGPVVAEACGSDGLSHPQLQEEYMYAASTIVRRSESFLTTTG